MSNFDTVAKLFHEHIEYLSLSADAIADVCDTAAAHLANAIVSEKKVFSIGVGLDDLLPCLFASSFVPGFGWNGHPYPSLSSQPHERNLPVRAYRG